MPTSPSPLLLHSRPRNNGYSPDATPPSSPAGSAAIDDAGFIPAETITVDRYRIGTLKGLAVFAALSDAGVFVELADGRVLTAGGGWLPLSARAYRDATTRPAYFGDTAAAVAAVRQSELQATAAIERTRRHSGDNRE